VVSILGLLIAGLLIGLVAVLFLYCRRRNPQKGDDRYNSTSSVNGLDMHIPRPRV
jgi:hypothetical protein